MLRFVACVAGSSLLAMSLVFAQDASKPSAVGDALFAAAAADSGTAELALSKLGAQKATHPDLKKFSEHMINDHAQLNKELLSLAGEKEYEIPRTVDSRAQFCLQSLAGLSGEEFDRCYAEAQLLMHKEAVSAFKAEAERGQDSEMKALANKALPKLKQHLKEIKPIAQQMESASEAAEK